MVTYLRNNNCRYFLQVYAAAILFARNWVVIDIKYQPVLAGKIHCKTLVPILCQLMTSIRLDFRHIVQGGRRSQRRKPFLDGFGQIAIPSAQPDGVA